MSANVSTTYVTCPSDPQKTLGIKLPFLVMIIKNLKKYFSFEVQVLDDKNVRRRFRASNYQVRPGAAGGPGPPLAARPRLLLPAREECFGCDQLQRWRNFCGHLCTAGACTALACTREHAWHPSHPHAPHARSLPRA